MSPSRVVAALAIWSPGREGRQREAPVRELDRRLAGVIHGDDEVAAAGEVLGERLVDHPRPPEAGGEQHHGEPSAPGPREIPGAPAHGRQRGPRRAGGWRTARAGGLARLPGRPERSA